MKIFIKSEITAAQYRAAVHVNADMLLLYHDIGCVINAKVYTELKPVAGELKNRKYRFAKARDKYKTEHESEIRRFYMVKRKLKDAGFEKEPFSLKAWQKEFSELAEQREAEYQEYKLMQKDLWMYLVSL